MSAVPGAEPVILYGYDSNGNLVPLRLGSDGTLSANGGLTLGSTPSTQAIGDGASGGSDTTASKNDHKHGMPAFASPAAIAYALANGVAATLPRSDHVHSLSLSQTSGVPAGNVNPGANTWGDLCTVSLVAGTWLIIGNTQASGGANASYVLKIYDATTPSPNTPVAMSAASPRSTATITITIGAIVVPAQTTTYTLAGLCDMTGSVFAKTAGPNASASGPATYLLAVRIG